MKTNFLLPILSGFFVVAMAVAQEATPLPTPKFAGGTVTGDAANGGPVGGNVSNGDVRDSGFNTGGDTGGSTAVKETPTPTPKPKATPTPTPTPTPQK